MFKNYLKIAWRNLLKNRRLSIINIVGLSISVAFCLLLFFYITYEQSYDSFHKKKTHLFRMEMTSRNSSADQSSKKSIFSFLTKDEEQKNQLVFPLIVGLDMKRQFPEIAAATRFADHSSRLVRVNKEIFKENHILYADDNFFSTFSFEVKAGDLKTALLSPGNVVLAESVAKKYFGATEAVGRTISFASDSIRLFKVAAIVEDAPENSSIKYSVVLPLLADESYAENVSTGFNHSSHLLVIELAENVSPAQFSSKMNVWVKKYFTEPFFADMAKYGGNADTTNFKWSLRPIAECHYNASGPWGHYTNAKNIYQLACLVIIILLIASLNYVLLVISNSAARSQEIGVRKVMGAKRGSIVFQFWIETQIIVVVSVVFGLALTWFLLPIFNDMIGASLRFTNFSWAAILPAIILLCLLLGIGAGYYPALIISKMKPVSVIKSFQTFKINPRFSKLIVVLQYTGCVVLMIAAFIINRQMHYINNKDLGFDKEQVLMVKNPVYNNNFTISTRNRLRDFARSQPYITQFSGMDGGLNGTFANSNGFMLNGEQKWRASFQVDYDYFQMMGIQFLQGRPFSRDFPSDTSRKERAVIVNEALFNLLGSTAKLGEYNEPIHGKIIGVVKNYNFESLSKKIEPAEHLLLNSYQAYFIFKIKAGQLSTAISKIGNEWKSITDYPFEYTFLDDSIAKMYVSDLSWQTTIQVSCFFAIFIACLGLFGLSAINAINRTREIGIRKVLGASVKDIVATLSSSFLTMIFIAIIIATPIAWWVMNKWLQDFAYRITISWWMFVVMGLIALLIALATVSFQAIKAAIVNPVKSLRSE